MMFLLPATPYTIPHFSPKLPPMNSSCLVVLKSISACVVSKMQLLIGHFMNHLKAFSHGRALLLHPTCKFLRGKFYPFFSFFSICNSQHKVLRMAFLSVRLVSGRGFTGREPCDADFLSFVSLCEVLTGSCFPAGPGLRAGMPR